MVQVPTTAGASSAHAMRASPAHTPRGDTPSKVNGHNGTQDAKHEKAPREPILSSLRSAPLDLSSVERRGQPTATPERPKQMRPHGLTEAPTYYPTMEEFKDPFAYIQKIGPEAEQYGIYKIQPPDDWKPNFAIDTTRFHFKTRKQELNSIEGSTRANLTYLDQLQKFHHQHGNNLNKFPSVDKRPLDLFKLKKYVELRGGFEKVCRMKKWAEIGRDLGYSGKIMSSLSTSLKNSYQRWLEPYEEYLRHAKPGVQAQLEFEYGGPLTPSPAPSPFKRPSDSHQHTPSSLRNDSPAIRASDALNASMHSASDMRDVPVLGPPYSHQSTPAPQAPPRSGFTPVNAGGFTPVNSAPAGFTPVNRREREREPERSFTPPWHTRDSPIASAKGTPEYKPSGLSSTPYTQLINGVTSNPIKKGSRQESHDSTGSKRENSENEEGSSGRRSKRLKKEAIPTVAGSHMSFMRPLGGRKPGEPGYFEPGEKCEQCGKGDEEGGQLLLCESCDHGYHMDCLEPPLTRKPEYEWNCPRCLVGDGQFGFEEGGIYSLKQFQEKAALFKENYFKDRLPFDPILNCPRPVTEDDIEREFWRLVASLEETVEVEYGADIHSTTHGSGFPTVEDKPDDPYSCDPWNLNVMPMAGDSLFRHIKSDISGMTVPWLYVGMIFSTFCWHNEDHYAYSANYQHFGATKTWYGVPAKDAENFEQAMRDAVPELFESQPDLLFQLVTLLTPEQLKKAGVEVYALDQHAGQFVITCPQAYHAGFNHGFNLNEAVNFAPKEWEPFGEAGVERLQQFRRQPCFSHDELLWAAAEGHVTGGVSVETAKWLKPALERMRKREVALRSAFHHKHYTEQPHSCALDQPGNKDSRCYLEIAFDEHDIPEEEYQCAYCKSYAYLSRFKCKTSGKVLCLSHAGAHECCDLTEQERFYGGTVRKGGHNLYIRHTEEAMDNMYQKISDKAGLPEAWEEKVTKALEEDAPSLKVLRTLLHEGERIPYELPSFPILKNYVEHCNAWVEEATSFLVRKQNRRKNEKRSKKANEAEQAEERRIRDPKNIEKMIEKAEELNFDSPEIGQLCERSKAIKEFKQDAALAITVDQQKTNEIEELLDRAHSLQVDLPEVKQLQDIRERSRWNDQANDAVGRSLTLAEVSALIEKAESLHIYPNTHHLLRHFIAQKDSGLAWEKKALELLSADVIHYPQLDALSRQAQDVTMPTTVETLAKVDQILNKQREAQQKIAKLYERTRDPDFSKRPKYIEVRDTMESLSELNSKPSGTLDLEKEQKRHEDWMRKGKKLFGKANAPLHILKTHMEYVLERNLDCFDIVHDKPRVPAEPASREPSPEDSKGSHSWEDPRFREVFCICRRVEAGMMIECEHCHEWYHGKCLKIARGKVKEDEKYTCPICDWRVKIPRDAARPKLEDLIDWQSEIANLPFQPEEEDILTRIIDNAQDFRNHVAPYCNDLGQTGEETDVQRFYLRKIEGAEILLVQETNFFRAALHKWDPVAPDPPPVLEQSKSTRKPRPTKLQKLMAHHGVTDPEDLPAEVRGLRTKMHRFGGQDGNKGTQSPQQQNQHQAGHQQPQQHIQQQPRQMMPQMGMGYGMPHQQPGVHMNGFPAHGRGYQDHGLGYGVTQPHQLHQTLAQLGQGPYGYEQVRRQSPYDRPLFEQPSGILGQQERMREPERDVERERGIERMFSDLTNTEEQAEEREEAQRRAEGGVVEKDKDVEVGGVVDGPASQGTVGGQAEEFLSTMALYGDAGEGSDSPRWEH